MFNCSCCQPENINDLEKTFNQKRAEKDAADYLKNGLEKRAQKMIAPLAALAKHPFSILEIGCGAGALHQELIRQGTAGSAVGIDASSASIDAATANADQLQLSNKINYQQADFAQQPNLAEAADLVVLDRVICCYPHLEKLLAPAAEKATQYLLLSYPIENNWLKFPFKAIDLLLTLFRSGYHPYLHPHHQIDAIAAKAGLVPFYTTRHWLWQITLFKRKVT